MNDGKPLIMTD